MKSIFKRIISTNASLCLAVVAAPAAVRYVDVNSSSPTLPYTNWATAAVTIQDAVDVADPGDTVLVTNGVYATGGRAVGTNLVGNRVVVDKQLTLRSVNGPQFTRIAGLKVGGGFLGCGEGAMRCVGLASGATLAGFTLTNGATRIDGDYAQEQSGGGIWCESQAAVVSNCVVTINGAWFGGGAYSGTLDHCDLITNSARTNGGGAYGSRLFDCALTSNSSRFGEGGGAFRSTLSNSILTSNLAYNSSGGGASESDLDHCTLEGNTATWAGGGAFLGSLNNCTLINNSALEGGGACLSALTNCTVIGNSAGSGGGTWGGTLYQCTLTGNNATKTNFWTGGGGAAGGILVNCRLDHNTSAGYGGGVVGNLGMGDSAQTKLVNCILTGNSALQGGGAYDGNLYNCTLTDNPAETGGGANASVLWNCIIYFNSAANLENYFPQSPHGRLNYCCTWPMPGGGMGNFTNAPMFADLLNGDLRLQSNSPCINAGNNSRTLLSYSSWEMPGYVWITNRFDLDGNPRIASGTVDIGAYEFQSPSSVLSYAWAQQYGLPTDGTADYAHSDADPHNNWQEWRADTNPTNALSVLRMLSPTKDASGVTVRWQSVTTRNYLLERGSNLGAQPPLSILQTNIPGQAGETSYTDTNAVGPGPFFYRVGVH